MAEFRSNFRSHGGDRKLEIVTGKTFSASQAYMTRSRSSIPPPVPVPVSVPVPQTPRVSKVSKTSSWSFNDPEMKRRKRVAKYKSYAVEGKVKASLRKGFRWISNKCSQIVHGF